MNASLRRNPSIPWDNTLFPYWEAGQTGYDIVDAGINELISTGFMNNLTRMVCANFLLFGLKCDWHLGEAFFRKHLVDYDLILNENNWYWCCGYGIDHPRPNNAFGGKQIRIFNPVTYATNGTPENKKVKKALLARWSQQKYTPCISIEQVVANQQYMASFFP
jgi:deoxyribodipyrimidine photo-lyase